MENRITANQQTLVAELDRIRHYVAADELDSVDAPHPVPVPLLDDLCESFSLSGFERDLLLLCAGAELDAGFASLVSEKGLVLPTFGMALARLPDAHWSALSPGRPLRYWRMLELGAGPRFVDRPLSVDERILNQLIGIQHLDERLKCSVFAVSQENYQLQPRQAAVSRRIRELWAQTHDDLTQPILNLSGVDATTRLRVAGAACNELGLGLYRMSASELPEAPPERETLARLWEREAVFAASALIIELNQLTESTHRNLMAFLHSLNALRIVSSDGAADLFHLNVSLLEIPSPTTSEKISTWRSELGDVASEYNGEVEAVTQQFVLSEMDIRSICRRISNRSGPGEPPIALWDECRRQARAPLDALAQRIEPSATIEDIVLPELQLNQLQQIASHVRHRARVYDDWGFAAKCRRGLGIGALFCGASGTGKTMAAEVLANELRLDLYRIDLSQIVSKYIGETEKNLARVFDCAQSSGCILLFDEADALFGKRSEVRDSHDRFANIEISYLLQRMEEYCGLSILTTNMKEALDHAFLRRLRFVISFPFPDARLRAEIWRRTFPDIAPVSELNTDLLATFDIAGGNIRNIAMNAAFAAAELGQHVELPHIIESARGEFAKLQRPFPDTGSGAAL